MVMGNHRCLGYTQRHKFATRFESRFTPGDVRIDRVFTTETTEITEG